MLHKFRNAMAQRDSQYTLSGFIEMDDAFFCGAAKGRGAANKSTVLVKVESKDDPAGFIAMQTVESMEREQVETVVKKRFAPTQRIRTDGYQSYSHLSGLGHQHDGSPVPSKQAAEELPWVDTAISNAKVFLLGTYHGVSHKHLQRYLDEFCYRFNRRSWEKQMTARLLTACLRAKPVTFAELTA